MKRRTVFFLLLILASAGMSGCGKSGDKLDMAPPEIVSMTPVSDASDVALNTLVTFTFDKDVSGVSQSSVVLNAINAPSVPVNTDITYDSSTKTVSIRPKNNLATDTYYVVAVTSEIRSETGVSMAATSWIFSTGQATDKLSPTITKVTPVADSSFVDVDTSLSVSFSESVIASTITADSITAAGTFRLKNINTSAYVPCAVKYNEGSYIATLTPSSDLNDWTNYQVELTGGITDLAGNALAGSPSFPLVYSFMTNDENSPVVKNKSPSGSNISRSTQVNVMFSESVSQSTVLSSSNFYVRNDSTGQGVPGTLSYDDSIKSAIFTPSVVLDAGTAYYVYLTNGITDIAGNALSSTSWSFTTGNAIADTVAPYVLGSMTPQPDSENVDPDTTVSVSFSEAVTGVGASSFTLKKSGSDTVIDAKIVYSESTHVATLTPKNSLAQNTEYTVQLTTAIKDNSGNSLITRTWGFTTADNTRPTIVSKIPGLVGNVAVGASVYIQFSERVQESTAVNLLNFKIENITGSIPVSIGGSISYDDATHSALFTPSSSLDYSSTYKVTVSGVKDITGNSILSSSWTFTTLNTPDETPPTVSSPTAAMEGFSISSQIDFSLSETVVANCINNNTVSLYLVKTGEHISASVSYNSGNNQGTILPDKKLLNNREYAVKVYGDVAGSEIKDLSGNQLANTSWTFKTEVDTTPPTVVYRSPENGTSGIAGNGVQIDVGFSEPVQGVSPSSFYIQRIKDKEGHSVTNGNIPVMNATDRSNASTNNYMYRLTLADKKTGPVKEEDQGTYAIVLTSDIKDCADAPKSVSFAAGSWTLDILGEDITKPTVTLKDPNPVAYTDPSTGQVIKQVWHKNSEGRYVAKVVFSELVNNVDGSSFKLERKNGTNSSGEDTYEVVEYDLDAISVPRTATISVTENYASTHDNLYNQVFRLSLTNTIKDTADNSLDAEQWYITADTDTDPPSICLVTPANGDQRIYYENTVVKVTFSEEIDPATISDSTFYLTKTGDTQKVAATYTFDVDKGKSIVTMKLSENLAGSTADTTQYYTATVTTGVTDTSVTRNCLQSDKKWSFSTSIQKETVSPWITEVTPSKGKTDAAQKQVFTITFSEKMLLDDKTASAYYYITTSDGVQVPTSATYDSSAKTVEVVPSELLIGGSSYYIVCSKDLTDLVGNKLDVVTKPDVFSDFSAGNPRVAFTVAADTTGPTCKIYYTDGSVETPWDSGNEITVRNPQFSIKFDEAVTGVSSSSVHLSLNGTDITSASTYVTYDSGSKTAYIQLKSDGSNVAGGVLQNVGSTNNYTISVASSIKDSKNNGLNKNTPTGATASATVISFTVPSALPKVTSVFFTKTNSNTLVTNNGSGPCDPDSISIVFNSQMNPDKVWFEIYTDDTQSGHRIPVTIGERVWSSDNDSKASDYHRTVTFPVVGSFVGSTTYYIRIYGWAGTFEDIHGNIIDKTSYLSGGVLTFTTGDDTTKPTVISHIPASDVTVGTTLPVVSLTFSEPMNESTTIVPTLTGSGTLTFSTWMDGGRTAVYTVSGLSAGAHTLQYSLFSDLKSNAVVAGSFDFSVESGTKPGVLNDATESFDLIDETKKVFLNYQNILADSTFMDGSSGINCDWIAVTSGNFQSAPSAKFEEVDGSYLALAADCTWDYGTYADLVSKLSSLNCSTPGVTLLSFSMAHCSDYNQSDRLEVWASTDDGKTYKSYGTVYRRDYSLPVSTAAWKKHYVDLTGVASSGAKLLLRAYSSGETGANVYIDKISVTRY